MAFFVMTIEDCTNMIFKALYLTKGKEIFILKKYEMF